LRPVRLFNPGGSFQLNYNSVFHKEVGSEYSNGLSAKPDWNLRLSDEPRARLFEGKRRGSLVHALEKPAALFIVYLVIRAEHPSCNVPSRPIEFALIRVHPRLLAVVSGNAIAIRYSMS
jgi:hypothetical protein